VHLKKRDRDELDRVLHGGVQQVRVVLRSLVLCQFDEGKSISEVASIVRLTSKAVREDILETCEKPYDPDEPVICLDEKSVTLHADVRPPAPAVPGREARQDSEYERCGTANVFCAVEPRAGKHFTFATPDRSSAEFAPSPAIWSRSILMPPRFISWWTTSTFIVGRR
jgi:hypothetical protein